MLLVNTPEVPGKKIEKTLGLVRGSTIRAKHIGKDISSAFRHLVGGEMKEYSEMLTEARQIATKQMIDEAEMLGANAVVNIRYSTSNVMQGAAEILAYGTAVVLESE
ncbi:YbjQ family protein [Fusibacter sp. JL298sf-3]